MSQRILALAAGAALSACSGPESGVDRETTSGAAAGASAWQQPMTEWGDPDLRGTWPIQHLIGTPFQRNEELGTREYYTDEEVAENAARLDATRNSRYAEEDKSNRIGMGHWAETTEAQRITSLIVDPPSGRFPALTDEGKRLSALMGSSWSTEASGKGFDRVSDFDTWDRCITRGLPPSMFPFNYNNGVRLHQAPGYVVIETEMIHEARIVPVDGRPALPSQIKQWMGESRGHWDGNTLVVETTNFNGVGGMTNVGIPGSPPGNTPTTVHMKITERFERVSDDQINYSMTVEDPEVLTSSWTARYPMYLDNNYKFFEYACHEDNTAVRNFIETSRFERAHRRTE